MVYVKLGFVVCNFLGFALLFFYFMFPPPTIQKRTMTHYKYLLRGSMTPSPVKDKLLEELSGKPPENTPDKPVKPPENTPVKPPKKMPEIIAKKLPDMADKKPPPLEKLPQYVIDRIKTFVFFVGHPCSGHSIVGSLIDSHPHMVVSHEYTLFQKLSIGSLAPTKPAMFNALWNFDIRSKLRTLTSKGYMLTVNGLYEGKYVDHIDVIGDKRGDYTVQLFIDHPSNWSSVYNILQSLNVTLKVIHVIRNPYDNIASHVFLNDEQKYFIFKNIKNSNKTYAFSSNHTAKSIRMYFQYHEVIVSIKETYNLDIIKVHGKDLISDPKGTLSRLCSRLGVTCSDEYLEKCSDKIYKAESRTRRLLKWTKEQLELIEQNIKKYSCLKGYTFDSM